MIDWKFNQTWHDTGCGIILFICRCCKADSPITDGLNTDFHLDTGNVVSLEKVDKFCYLGDTLDAGGGCDSAVTN